MRHTSCVPGGREELRGTFEFAAARYQRPRPDYPIGVYDELESAAGLRSPARDRVTIPLAQRGYRIMCVELGRELSAEARRNLAAFPDVEVVHTNFEHWEASTPTPFDLVFAATAWHWIDPESRCRKVAELLRAGGHLAFWSAAHVFPDSGDTFFREIQAVYDEIGEGLPPGAQWERPDELADSRTEIDASGLFGDVTIRRFDWEVVYDADSYLELLDTFSGHIAMPTEKREHLYAEIRRRLAARPGGLLNRHWGAVLHVAQCRE